MKVLIPKDFKRIAVYESATRAEDVGIHCPVQIYWEANQNVFMIKHSDKEQLLGPITLPQLLQIGVAIADVKSAAGMYNTIELPEDDE
jgi:hypothetical protein